jgi:hypothetical protein
MGSTHAKLPKEFSFGGTSVLLRSTRPRNRDRGSYRNPQLLNGTVGRVATPLREGPFVPRICGRVERTGVERQVMARPARLKPAIAGDLDAAEAMMELIETVTVFRDTSRLGGVAVEIVGRLNALLGKTAYPNGVKGVWGKMVAEVCYRRIRQPCSRSGRPRKAAAGPSVSGLPA